jgi:hypothetical protein
VPLLLSDRSTPQARALLQLMGLIKKRLVEEKKVGEVEQEKERPRLFGR